MYTFDEPPRWITRLLALAGVLLIAVSGGLADEPRAIGLWAGIAFATCGFLTFFWQGYRRSATLQRQRSSMEAIDLIVLSLAGITVFSAVTLAAILAQRPHLN